MRMTGLQFLSQGVAWEIFLEMSWTTYLQLNKFVKKVCRRNVPEKAGIYYRLCVNYSTIL